MKIRIAEYPSSRTASINGGRFVLEERKSAPLYKWLPFIRRYYWSELRYGHNISYETLSEAKEAAKEISQWPKYYYI